MHKYIFQTLFPCLLILALCLPAVSCKHRAVSNSYAAETAHPSSPKDLVISRSAVLKTQDKSFGETASVIISDHKGLAGHFAERLTEQLRMHGFEIGSQPSRSERLVSSIILYRGPGTREQMEANVRSDYGGAVSSMHGHGSVLVADLMVVRRRVPENKTSLRSISAHNTVSSTRVRIGLFSDERHILDDRSLEEALANEIAGIAAYTIDEQKHTPSVTSPIKSTPKKSKKSKKTRKKTKNRR